MCVGCGLDNHGDVKTQGPADSACLGGEWHQNEFHGGVLVDNQGQSLLHACLDILVGAYDKEMVSAFEDKIEVELLGSGGSGWEWLGHMVHQAS